MVERGACEHEAVEQRRGHTDGSAGCERAQHAARGRAVQIEPIADPAVHARDHERLPVVGDEADLADERLVEDRVDHLAIVDAALREPADLVRGEGAGAAMGLSFCSGFLYHYKVTYHMIQKTLVAAIRERGGDGIARDLEAAIRDGRLAPGDRLPPVRGLADALAVSPTTVAAAYRACAGAA